MQPYPIERRAANRAPPPSRRDALGLRGAADAILRRWPLALGVFIGVFGLSVLYQWLAAPIYRADTVLEIEGRPRTSLLPSLAGGDRAGIESERTLASGEIEVLRSREVLMPAILASGSDVEIGVPMRWGFVPMGSSSGIAVPWFSVPEPSRGQKFSLTVDAGLWSLRDSEGRPIAEGPLGQAKRFELGAEPAWIVVNAPVATPKTTVSLRLKTRQRAYEDVLESMRLFEPARESNVLRLSVEDVNPARAAALLNMQVAQYLSLSNERRSGPARRALSYLEEQLPSLQQRMAAAEDALRVHQAATSAAPFTNEVDALLRQRADLERQQTDLRVKRDQLAQNLTPDHPDMAAVNAQLGTVERALGRFERQTARYPVQQRDAVRLQREVQVSTQLYTTMLGHVQQLQLNTAGVFSGARQLDPAVVPAERLRPKAAATLSVGAALGLLAALAAVLLARALQPTIDHGHELTSSSSAPATLAIIPESEAQNRLSAGRMKSTAADEELGAHRLLARAAPDDPAVESLRAVHVSLMLRSRRMPSKVVLITSPTRGAGKSFIAANLSALMAEAGKRVLLIDADLRKPGVHEFVSLDEHAPGLADVLAGQRALDDVIRRHAAVDMDVILHGTGTGNPGSLLQSPILETALDTLRERYDHIVICAAPMLPAGDAVAAGRVADLALLVVRAEESLLHETQAAQHRLEQAGIKLEGVLVNGAKRNRLSAPRLA